MDTSPVVRARGITKYFGDVVALDGVDLDIAAGEVHGLVGPNGAGKTTLLGVLLGLAAADEGRLEVLGRSVGGTLGAPSYVSGFVDGPGLYPFLTARQNLTALATLQGGRGAAADVAGALGHVGLADVADDHVRGFSLGMRQRLGLAAALLARPRLLVLDEPANGLDPAGRRHVHRVISDLAAQGVGVVLSSHRMDDVETWCSTVTILARGRVVFAGPPEKLAAESGDVDYRLVTSDPATTRGLAEQTRGVRLVDGTARPPGALVLGGPLEAIDELVGRVVRAGVAVRELGPVVSPLEAAFLALTDQQCATDEEGVA